ncbi:sigma-70 family RNA polymerase sigma factor [Mucilaginibacter sp. RS28]|uniref:Sigma-70 family RNA polymerase sigma factor n=1 Tax=Mucilaginibacter straminoryzae TaxID=2932774 RepID=A0A9X2BA40_9SPHI|nr:sigma-70 family RNA polymerase sigma factor [Mucilaginibacter straminoryzae]MCJ8211334.1 sigma-70 family RNA polymerase sigma factor [Mucilaginibacter straminoryzae]
MTTAHLESDAELIELISGNDYAAFEVIYSRHSDAIRKILIRILKSEQLADDLCQEIFLHLWSSRYNLGHIKAIKGYLLTTARNRALDHLKAALRTESTMANMIRNFNEQRNTTDEELLTKEYLLFLNRILSSLPERTRQIFSLCREQGKSYDEVAQMLDISRSAVKNHMVLSMKVLSKSVQKELGISLSMLLACIFRH